MARLTMIQAINLALTEAMGADDDVVVLGEDVGINGGVFRATEGLYDRFGEARVIDTPLAESGIVGTSIGMAMAGLKPVCEMQFSGFSYLAIGQIEGHAGRVRNRSQGQYSVPMVVRMPYGGGVRALEHHSESKEATYAHMPGLKVVTPSTPRNARALLRSAIDDPDTVIFMEPKHSYRAWREEVPEEDEFMEIGKSRVVREGGDLTLVTWGSMLRTTEQAADALAEKRGARVELIDLLTISPMDSDTITDSVRKTGRCVVVQEAHRSLGVSSEIIARINDKALMHLEAPVGRVTGYDVVPPGFSREKAYMPTPERVLAVLEQTLDF